MPIAYDMCRCVGAKDESGQVVDPCNKCRRFLEKEPSGPRSPWFVEPPLKDGKCMYLWGKH